MRMSGAMHTISWHRSLAALSWLHAAVPMLTTLC
jgi:hypothetical protein